MKKTKRIIASFLACCAIASSLVINASAISSVFAFSFGRGENGYAGPVQKSNYLTYATVNVTSGNLTSSTFMYFCLYNSNQTSAISDSVLATGNGSYKIYYVGTTPAYGNYVYLKGLAGYQGGQAAGSWEA